MRTRVQIIADKGSLWSTLAVMLGVMQFVYFVTTAISLFPGGYSVTNHFLSDLGRTDNPSAPYFNGSLIVLASCLIFFFVNMARSNVVSGVAGVISSVGLLGLGLTPLDRAFLDHHIALFFWLAPMFVIMVASAIEGIRNRQVLVVLGSVAVLYFGMMYVGAAGTSTAPSYQKLVACLSVVWLVVVCGHSCIAVYRETTQLIRTGHDHQTRTYISQLQRNGLTSRDGQRTGHASPPEQRK